ncbi:MAG: LemA family protein [Pseudodonghicola sp.]|nr:LemA family protein [Pseudodonghicola sp.]
MIAFSIVLAVVLIAVLYAVILYNALVRARQMMREGWSGIDVQLKRRADLIPNLIEAVKGYAAHERQTFEVIVEARNRAVGVAQGDVEGRAKAESALGKALGNLFALSEAYPDLKASSTFLELQGALDKIEHDIQMARRYYNGAARDLNVRVESFPSNLVAGRFGFAQQPYFEIEDAAERAVPAVRF